MSLLCRRLAWPATLKQTRNIGLSAFYLKRNSGEKLKQPEDKSQVVIGKRKLAAYFPKEGVSDKIHPIHVEWQRPVTMQTCNPEISGDVGGLESLGLDTIDLTLPLVALEKSPEMHKAPAEVKRVLSLEFARRKDVLDKLSQQVLQSVQRHSRDFDSLEVRIAMMTIKIRNSQWALIQQWPYKNQPVKHLLTHRVSNRRKMLRILREKDYKKYEWLLEKLNLLYKPMPWDTPDGVLGVRQNVARKASISRLTDMWCNELERHRLTAYSKELEQQKPVFLREKAEKLRIIIQTEKDLGVEPTVLGKEVEMCLTKAQQLEDKLAMGEDDEEEEEYLVFSEETVREENTYIG